MHKCHLCETTDLIKSDPQHFTIERSFLPEEAKRFSINMLSLWICRQCGLMEVHHKSRGYQGSYGVLWHEFWYAKFRSNTLPTILQADRFYDDHGYAKHIPRSSFIRDFTFQKRIWDRNGGGPKSPAPMEGQNTLFDEAA